MNLREGTRRLALLMGGLGAIAGCVLSYFYLQPVMRQREMHKAFEKLANSDVVTDQRKIVQSHDPFGSIAKPIPPPPSGTIVMLPPGATLKPIPQHGRAKLSDITPAAKVYLDDNGNPIAATSSTASPAFDSSQPSRPAFIADTSNQSAATPTQRRQIAQPELDWTTAQPVGVLATNVDSSKSEVNKGGIATINWSHDYGVASIETTEGETLSPMPAPARWQYLLGALLPVLGFLIPWGAIRAIGWVVTGFVQPSK